jgi:hypothetical protein
MPTFSQVKFIYSKRDTFKKNGKAVFASGSPFPKYEAEGIVREPGQGKQCLHFPR